jgi:hypothetical protein
MLDANAQQIRANECAFGEIRAKVAAALRAQV